MKVFKSPSPAPDWGARAQNVWSEPELEQWHRLYALRSQLAGFAARQAASRAADGVSIESLNTCFKTMREAADCGDYEAFFEADMGFHSAIARLAETPVLEAMWALLESEMRPFAAWAQRALFRDLQAIAASHQTQIDLIRQGRAKAAERTAHADLDSLWQMLLQQPAEVFEVVDPVERVCGYVMANLHRPLTLSQVARDIAHLSPSYLAKLFHQARHESFSAYVQGLRLRRAAALLDETDWPIGDIATRVGYLDASRFAAHFRRRFECSPVQFRRKKSELA